MSEEFYMSVSFEMPDAERMTALETLIEHFDLCETEQARKLLAQYELAKTTQLIEKLTSSYSDYVNGSDLVTMYADTYNDCVDDLELEIDASAIKGEISIDGNDREADDFCASLALILVVIGASHINARAGAPMWNANWIQSGNGDVEFIFEAEE